MKQIQEIADKYGLKVIYDAAHAFGVEVDGESVLNAGDISTLSFHATKVYNTLEGGALVMHDEQTKKRIDYLKNFGFAGETEVVAPGINSKMDEVRAAYGLLNLKQVDAAIEKRHKIAVKYRETLRSVPGIRFFDDMVGVRHNYSYFPIFINEEEYGMARDDLYFKISKHAIDMAERLKGILSDAGFPFLLESPTNQQFVILDNSTIERLKKDVGFEFWETVDEDHTAVRFATSWSTTEKELDKLQSLLK